METMHKSSLYKAVMLALTTTVLVACGSDDDNDKKSADTAKNPSSISKVAALTANTSCTNGGHLVHSGIDDNGNGVLDDNEIDDTVEVCDGQDGSDGQDGNNGQTANIKFVGVKAPLTDEEKRDILVSQAVVNGKIYGGEYKTIARSGDVIDGIQFGQLVDENGATLKEQDGSVKVTDSNEYTSLLPIGSKLYSVSQMESRPGAMFLFELNQNAENGELSVASMSQIDQSGVDGGWVHCAGSVTPWTTHLASEEYEPNAKAMPTHVEAEANGYSSGMLDYYADVSKWNPYFYGWNIEVKVNEDATTELTKHYAMARLAFELSYVMPDQKTVYMTDDGTNVGLYMFVADTAGDLSSGTTYAAKWNQTSAQGAGAAELEWINLGYATNSEVKSYIDNGTTFVDIFDEVAPVNDQCDAGYVSINAGGNGQECLKVKAGMEQAASRLETRRYAAMKGATTEFRKEEGITYDSKRHKMYLAMSAVERGMENNKKAGSDNTSYDVGGLNHIQLDSFNSCGAVYELDLGPVAGMKSDYVAKNMKGLVAGRPIIGKNYGTPAEVQALGYEDRNKCHIDGIANPDNVTYMSGYDLLIIGEDTGSGHQNDVIWAYDFSDEKLTRIQTTPYGAETTSPYWYPNINGWSYMTSVVQHPYGESDGDKDTGNNEARAYTGYIGPFPAVSQ